VSTTSSKIVLQHIARPAVAVELAPEGVLAAALPGKGQSPVYAFKALQAGVLMPGIDEPNLRAPDQVTAAISAALAEVSPRSRAVTVVLPDTSVRVFVLDFDSLPPKAAEVIPVLKFRLRKMVPFDVEHAGVSYQVLTETKNECRVLIAVMPGPILEEYEAAVRGAGYEPGAVLPSSLAAMAAVETEEPVLAACMNSGSLTTTITSGQDLLLYRTLDLPADAGQRLAEVQRDIAVAAAYFEDKLASRPRRLYYAGANGADEFARWINDPELTVVELTTRPTTGGATALGRLSVAGIAGALAGAA
jgi:type IV pilus assembly protein PilM